MWRTFLSTVGAIVLVILGYICFVYVTTSVAARGWYGVTSNNIASDGLKPVIAEIHKMSAQGDRIENKVDHGLQRADKIDRKVTKNGEGIDKANAGIDKIQECLGPLCEKKTAKSAPKTVPKVVTPALPAPPAPVVAPVVPEVLPTGDWIKVGIEASGQPARTIARNLAIKNTEPCCPAPPPAPVVEERQPQRQPPPTNCEDRRWRGRCFGR